MQYCRTNKAIEWLNDGDTIQHLANLFYFKKKEDSILFSNDAIHWDKFREPLETFPPYDEWRSITNLHYYDEIEGEKSYLTSDDRCINEDDPEADKTKKRWFTPIFYKGE